MKTPENKAISIACWATQDLWHRAVAGDLESNNLRLERRLRALDKRTQRLFESAFGQTFREKRASIADTVTVDIGDYRYIIGYDNHEENVGLRELTAFWGNRSWALKIDLYHFVGYHRLRQVIIEHQGRQVMFLYPEKFVGKIVPANTLPTDIEIRPTV